MPQRVSSNLALYDTSEQFHILVDSVEEYAIYVLDATGNVITWNTGAQKIKGYSGEEMTAHGFRTMASTLLNETGVHPDLIELQLAHAERNTVRAAYNRAQRLAERREMMQCWADYLDKLRKNTS